MRMKISRCFGAVLCIFGIMMWLAAGLVMNVSAASANNSLTLICETDDVTLAGMHWDLYRVGSRTDGGFALYGDFADYPVSLDDMTASALSAAADTLENYAIVDKIPSIAQGETDSDGLLEFDGLEPGLYMTCGKNLQIGDMLYVPSALLVEIRASEDDGQTGSDLDAYPKFSCSRVSSEDSELTVKKIWKNDENGPRKRAESVSVEIYRDAKLWKTVVLEESNDWSYNWTENTASDWRVKETDIPADYTVIYDSNETQFAIVNTYGGDTTSTDATTSPGSPAESGGPQNTAVTAATKLPQTGQLWWPVPLSAVGGIVFISVGVRLNSGNNREDE